MRSSEGPAEKCNEERERPQFELTAAERARVQAIIDRVPEMPGFLKGPLVVKDDQGFHVTVNYVPIWRESLSK